MSGNKQLANYISHIINKLEENDIYVEDVGAGVKVNIRRERDGENFANGVDYLVVYQTNDGIVMPLSTQLFNEEDDFSTISAIRHFIKLVPGMGTVTSLKNEGRIDTAYLVEKKTPATTSTLSNYHGLKALDVMNILKEEMHGLDITLNQELTKEQIKIVGDYVRTHRLGDLAN